MDGIRVFFGVVIVGGLVAAAFVLMYLLNWWIFEDSVNREAEIRRDQFEIQETARDELVRQSVDLSELDVQIANPDLTDQQRAALEGQRTAIVRQICNVASDISGSVTPVVDEIITTNC